MSVCLLFIICLTRFVVSVSKSFQQEWTTERQIWRKTSHVKNSDGECKDGHHVSARFRMVFRDVDCEIYLKHLHIKLICKRASFRSFF
jgi:hypothetical protein